MTRRASLAALLATVSLVAAPAFAHATGPSPGPRAADGAGTPVARVVLPGWARRAPVVTGAPVLWLERRTAWSGRPQVLKVTGRHRDAQGRRWVRVHLPVRPNGAAGWVPERHVRLSETRVRIVVRRGARVLEVWRGPHRLHRWPAGVGRPSTPTPLGDFAVQDTMRTLPAWRGAYGSHTVALTAHSPVLTWFMGGEGLVAVHGGRLGRVGQAASNGCVILAPGPLAALARIAAPGTPVRVIA